MPAEVINDDDVDQVKPINRLYFIATQWQKALDELKSGHMGRERMMAENQLYAKGPNQNARCAGPVCGRQTGPSRGYRGTYRPTSGHDQVAHAIRRTHQGTYALRSPRLSAHRCTRINARPPQSLPNLAAERSLTNV